MLPLLVAALEPGIPHPVVAGAHERAGAFVAGSAESVANHRRLSDFAAWRRQSFHRIAGAVIAADRLTVLLQKVHDVGTSPSSTMAVPSCMQPKHMLL